MEVDYVKQKNAQEGDVGKNVETLANQDFSIDVNKSANYQGRLRYNLRRLNNVLNTRALWESERAVRSGMNIVS